MKYIRLYESQDELKALEDIYELGLIDQNEYLTRKYRLDPDAYGTARILLELDWDWAAQVPFEEAEAGIMQLLVSDLDTPEGSWINPKSIYIESWEESDFWEKDEDEDADEGDVTPNYGFQPSVDFELVFSPGLTDEEIGNWAYINLQSAMFSNIEVDEINQPD